MRITTFLSGLSWTTRGGLCHVNPLIPDTILVAWIRPCSQGTPTSELISRASCSDGITCVWWEKLLHWRETSDCVCPLSVMDTEPSCGSSIAVILYSLFTGCFHTINTYVLCKCQLGSDCILALTLCIFIPKIVLKFQQLCTSIGHNISRPCAFFMCFFKKHII